MKKIVIALFCVGTAAFSTFAQASRPRVVATPQPQAPTLQNDAPASTSGRRPPVLVGGQTRPSTTPTPVPTNTPAISEENEIVKVETSIVTMPVSVIDRDGRFISGLTQRDFRVYENGVEQKIEYFQSVEQPFTIVLMIDVSPSTAFRIDEIHQAAMSFVDQLRPNDRMMVVEFDDDFRVLSPVTSNRNQLKRSIQMAQFGDGTSLYEAVDRVINQELKQIQGRKAVVIFTDGVDTTSRRANSQSTLADAEEADALFYPIRYNTQQTYARGGGSGGGQGQGQDQGWIDLGRIIFGDPGDDPSIWRRRRRQPAGTSPEDYANGLRYLEGLANNTGGRKFEADTTYNLDASFAGIAEELRRQYSLGYYPDKVGQAGDRKQIRVRVMRPNLVVRAKTTYIVGQSGSKFAGK